MLDRIISFSLRHRALVLVFSALLVCVGLYTAFHTEVDVFPDLNAPTVVVMTEANGMAAEEVEQLVTFPIEAAVNGATGVSRVRSSSTNGFSVVWVEFDWNTDIYIDRQIVNEKLSLVSESLPATVGKPTMGPQSSILGEMLIIGLTADSTSLMDLRTLADWSIRPQLLSVGGVSQISVLGGDVKEYQIQLDPIRMRHYDVSLQEVLAATEAMNQNVNGGVVNQFGNEYIVRGILSTVQTDKLCNAVVKTIQGKSIVLADVAQVRVAPQQPKMGTASVKGQPAVLLTVTKQPKVGTIELTQKIEHTLADLAENLPADVRIHTDIFRQSKFIESSIGNVKESLYEGIFFVIIVLFVFLANTRTTLISLVSMPLSLIVSLLVLHYMGLTINTMSLGGMAIAIGSLVDDAIVDVENVWRHVRRNHQLPASQRLPIIKVVFQASREVRMPILNSTLIIVVSFLPLFLLSGMEGRMLIPLGIAFVVALCASTLVALTLTPVLCSLLLRKIPEGQVQQEPRLSAWLHGQYGKLLQQAFRYQRLVVGGVVILFVAALVGFFTLGRSFLPSFNEGSFTINVSSLPGISLEESDSIGRRVELALLRVPEIHTVARKTGRAELDEHALGVNVSEIEAPFELTNRSRSEVIEEVRNILNEVGGGNIEIGQPISHRIDAMLSGTQASIAVKLFGDDLNKMYALGSRIKQTMQEVDGVVDLNLEQQIERPQLCIEPRREMLARFGITLADFAGFVQVNLAGKVVSQVFDQGKSFDVVVKTADDARNDIDKIRNLLIDTATGQKIPLYYVADVKSLAGPNSINRENVMRKLVISANAHGRDVRSIVNDIQREISKDITLPQGYRIEYGGQFESEASASRTLFLASLLCVVLIFLLINNEFHNLTHSAVILINLPLALIGGVFALLVTTGELSIPAIIGFISLFGIATRNGMLLISRYNTLMQQGMSVRESILTGSLDRLNPILMTALSSAFALIPLALRGDLAGNEIQSPMAKVILGGLLTATFFNAVVIPIVYSWLNRKKEQ